MKAGSWLSDAQFVCGRAQCAVFAEGDEFAQCFQFGHIAPFVFETEPTMQIAHSKINDRHCTSPNNGFTILGEHGKRE